MLTSLDLMTAEFTFRGAVSLLTGCVRAFAGFGLSAAAMAVLAAILPPG